MQGAAPLANPNQIMFKMHNSDQPGISMKKLKEKHVDILFNEMIGGSDTIPSKIDLVIDNLPGYEQVKEDVLVVSSGSLKRAEIAKEVHKRYDSFIEIAQNSLKEPNSSEFLATGGGITLEQLGDLLSLRCICSVQGRWIAEFGDLP